MLGKLFEKRQPRAITLRQQAEALYAQLKDAHLLRAASGTPLRGQHTMRKGGSGHDFWQYRDFQTGDTARGIDWKQSGKSDRLLIRQKQQETQQRIAVWLDNNPGMMTGEKVKYDTASVIALTIAMLCQRHHDVLKLCGAGALSIDALTGTLADAAYQPEISEIGGDEIFLIGDFLQPLPELETLFAQVPGGRPVHLIQILSSDELDLPFSGRVVFEHPVTTDKEQILNVATVREAYLQKLRAHLSAVEDAARRQNWSYTLIRSGDDLLAPMLDILSHEGRA